MVVAGDIEGHDLVPGRECGTCNSCCVDLTIDSPDLQKPPGILCVNYVYGTGCAIYPSRPGACRTWYCGWRKLDWLTDHLWPPNCGILVRVVRDGLPTGVEMGLVFAVLTSHGALDNAHVRDAIKKSVTAKIPTYMGVPGPPGYAGRRFYLNDTLSDAIRSSNAGGIKTMLRRVYFAGRRASKQKVSF